MRIRFQGKKTFEYICCCVITVYLVCAIAFETTPNTATFNTLAIYSTFLVGMLLIVVQKNLKLNLYVASIYFLFTYILLMSFATGAASNVLTAYHYLTCAVLCYVVYYITFYYKKAIYYLVWGYVLGSLVLAYRIIQYYGGVSALIDFASISTYHRVGGEIINENSLGLYMGGAVLSSIWIILQSTKRRKLLCGILLPCVVVFAFVVLLSGSKKAIAFLLISVVALYLLYARNASVGKKILVILGLSVAILLLFQAIRTLPFLGTINARLEQLINTLTGEGPASDSDQLRLSVSQTGIEAFLASPLFGNGTGHSYILFGTYSHNNFVELLMNYGIIGFGAYYFPYAVLLFLLYNRIKHNDLIAAYFMIYVVLQIALGIGWVNYYERVVQVITAAAWGYVDHYRDRERGSS